MNIERISVTRKQIWDTCRQQYKYRYFLKLESPEPEPFYFEYGKIVHKIAEEYVANKGERTLNEIRDAVIHGEIEIENGKKASKIPPAYMKRLPGHIRSIEALTKQIGFKGKLEHWFELDLDPPHNKRLVGVIDRLIANESKNKIFIIDYKTTKKGIWRKTPQTIGSDLQLRAYSRAVQVEYEVKAKQIAAALYYVEGGNLVPARFTQKAIDGAVRELITAFDEIKATNPDSIFGKVGNHCFRCDYKTICPYYRSR